MDSEPAHQAPAESDLDMATPSTTADQVRPGLTISGPFIPEAMEVLAVVPFGASLKVIGRGAKTGHSYDPVLSPEQIAQLKVSGESEPFDGSASSSCARPAELARRISSVVQGAERPVGEIQAEALAVASQVLQRGLVMSIGPQ